MFYKIAFNPATNSYYNPSSIEDLFNAIRFDWEEAYSTLMAENFVIHLN